LIEWIGKFLERSRLRADSNKFCLEFGTALLANLLSTKAAIAYLQKNTKVPKDILNISLNSIKEKLTIETLWHILMGLSHLTAHKEAFAGLFEESHFSDKIADFQELYS
jgi:hypothetical protein